MAKMIFEKAPDIQERMNQVIAGLDVDHLNKNQIVCMRSTGSKSRARARIWAFPRIWQQALGLKPYYVIEFLEEYFGKLSKKDQTKVIIHELLHIPQTFSGALRPHRMRRFNLGREVTRLYKQFVKSNG